MDLFKDSHCHLQRTHLHGSLQVPEKNFIVETNTWVCASVQDNHDWIGRQSERWRWDVEEAIQSREHTLNSRDIAAIDSSVTISEVPPNLLASEDWHVAFWVKWSHQEKSCCSRSAPLKCVWDTPFEKPTHLGRPLSSWLTTCHSRSRSPKDAAQVLISFSLVVLSVHAACSQLCQTSSLDSLRVKPCRRGFSAEMD